MVPYEPVILVFALAVYSCVTFLAAALAALLATSAVLLVVALVGLPFDGGRRFVFGHLGRAGYGPARWRMYPRPDIRGAIEGWVRTSGGALLARGH